MRACLQLRRKILAHLAVHSLLIGAVQKTVCIPPSALSGTVQPRLASDGSVAASAGDATALS